MAFFGVTIETIEKVYPHPNADRLELAKLDGMEFQFVIPKGVYTSGEEVIYFPIDSLLPDWVSEKMGLLGKLSGSKKNRVKTVRLRDEISQGIVGKLDMLGEDVEKPDPTEIDEPFTTEQLTQYFGVEKYEPPVQFSMMGGNQTKLTTLPEDLTIYDIEGAERYKHLVEALMTRPCWISEKVEGSNFSVTIGVDRTEYVNSRRHTIETEDKSTNPWWQVAIREGILDFANAIADEHPGKSVTVYGEMLGPKVQKNIYKFPENTVRLFDLKINGLWVNTPIFIDYINKVFGKKAGLILVPTLGYNITLEDWLLSKNPHETDLFPKGVTIQQASNGYSMLYPDVRREGIVIKPLEEEYIKGRRLIIKQRSPIYLADER
jgi:RNA ligase (TIGR02306 family)